MTYRLIFDGPIEYSSLGELVARNARVWEGNEGDRVCIVSEDAAAEARSITNAAEDIIAAAVARWGNGCAVVHHFPASGIGAESYHLISRGGNGQARWDHLDIAVLMGEFAVLLQTSKDTREGRQGP